MTKETKVLELRIRFAKELSNQYHYFYNKKAVIYRLQVQNHTTEHSMGMFVCSQYAYIV